MKLTERLKEHLLTAKDKARRQEEKDAMKEKEEWHSYTDLGLPPGITMLVGVLIYFSLVKKNSQTKPTLVFLICDGAKSC